MLSTMLIKPAIVYSAFLAILLILQMFLCLKAKRKPLKLIPIALSVVTMIVMVILFFTTLGWDKIGALFFIFYTIAMMVMCALGWVIPIVVKKINDKRSANK